MADHTQENERRHEATDRAKKNRSAWPVPMHVEDGELKEDKAPGADRD